MMFVTLLAEMAESQTSQIKLQLASQLRADSNNIQMLEQVLYQQRKQRPYNAPYIAMVEKQLKKLLINCQHLKDRLDKLDGCF